MDKFHTLKAADDEPVITLVARDRDNQLIAREEEKTRWSDGRFVRYCAAACEDCWFGRTRAGTLSLSLLDIGRLRRIGEALEISDAD